LKIITMASRNVLRNWRRTLVTTLAMGFAGLIMILFASLMEGLLQASERNAVAMDLGDIQIHAYGYRDDPDLYNRIKNPEKIVKAIKAVGLYATQRLYGFGLVASGSASAGVQLRGIDLINESTVTQIHNHVFAGKWLDKNDPKGVVLGKKLAKTLGVKPGDELVFVGQASDGSMANDLYNVRGILKSVGEEIDRAGLYMIEEEFRKLMVVDEGAHEIAVMRPDRSTDLVAARNKVASLAPGYETLDWRSLKPVIARILDLADAQMIIMVSITYVAVAMIVLNAMLMSVFERIRELGIMKAIGVKPLQIMLMVYMETIVQIVIASIIALVLGVSISYYFQGNGIDLSNVAEGASFAGVAIDPIWRAYITPEALLVPIIFLFIIALLAVLYPAVKAAVIRPVSAIHHR
jgi:ABC-type lipoprotein release transport system permease subunit